MICCELLAWWAGLRQMSCGSVTVARLHVVVAWGVVEGVGQAKQVRGETLKPRASGSVIREPG